MWFAFALAAAFSFGIRGVLYQWTSQRSVDRNTLLLGVYLSGTLIALLLNLIWRQPWNEGVWFGIPMGVFSFVANLSMYKGFTVGRASIIALLTGLSPVVVVIGAYVGWGEALTVTQLTGFIILLLGLLCIRYSADLKMGQLKGWQWGILTMLFFGFTDMTSKQATMFDAQTLPLLTVMFGTGFLLFGTLAIRDRKSATNRPASGWGAGRSIAWGMFVGISNMMGMILIILAFRDGVTGMVTAVVAMNIVVVLLYARYYLREKLSRNESIGLLLALVGIIVIRMAI